MKNCDTTANLRVYTKDFLQVCEIRNLNKSTMKAYRTNLQQFCTFLDEQEAEITEESVLAYLSAIQERFKPTTVNQKIASITLFLNYLADLQVIPENPVKTLNIQQHKQEESFRIVEMDVIEDVLQSAYREKALAEPGSFPYLSTLRDIAVLEILFLSGMRVSELCQLSPHDVNVTTKTVHIEGAGNRQRTLQIESEETLQALSSYQTEFWPQMVDADRYFVNRLGRGLSDQSVRNMLKRYAALAGVGQEFTPKVLRDSVATLLADEGADLLSLQHLLGHNSINRTQRYAQTARGSVATRNLRKQLKMH